MGNRIAAALIVALLLAACGDDPPPVVPPPDHEDLPRVRARVEALRSHLEAELGEDAVAEDPVAVLSIEDLSRRANAETSWPEAVFGPAEEEPKAGGVSFLMRVFPFLVTDAGILLLANIPEEDASLDARLIDGLVRAAIARRWNLGPFRSKAADLEDALVRHYALRNLVERIGHRVAIRAGVEAAYAEIENVGLGRPQAADELDGYFRHRFYVSRAGEVHLREAAARYVTRLIDRHGLWGAAERIVADPPRTVGTLLDPEGRATPSLHREMAEAVRDCLADELECDGVMPVVLPQLEALVVLAGAPERRAASEAFLAGLELSANVPDEIDEVRVHLLVARDSEAARAILRARLDSIRALDARWRGAERPWQRLDSFRESELRGGILIERLIDTGAWGGWPRVEQWLGREGGTVVEIRVVPRGNLDTDARSIARKVQAALRSAGAPALAPDALESPSWFERWRAVREIGRVTSLGRAGHTALITARTDPDRDVRLAAWRALRKHGLLSPDLRDLTAADPDWEIRWLGGAATAADESLSASERARRLLPLLGDADSRVRVRACRHIGELDGSGGAIPWTTLRPLLSDESPGARAAAFASLGSRLPDRTVPANGVLLAGLADTDGEVRYHAAAALPALGSRHPKIARAYRGALADRSPSVRQAALRSLAELKPPPPDLVSVVEAFLDDEEDMVRESALRVLGRFETLPDTTRTRIVRLTDDEDASIRAAAVEILGHSGVKSEAVVAALKRALGDKDQEVRMNGRKALKKLGITPPKPKRH